MAVTPKAGYIKNVGTAWQTLYQNQTAVGQVAPALILAHQDPVSQILQTPGAASAKSFVPGLFWAQAALTPNYIAQARLQGGSHSERVFAYAPGTSSVSPDIVALQVVSFDPTTQKYSSGPVLFSKQPGCGWGAAGPTALQLVALSPTSIVAINALAGTVTSYQVNDFIIKKVGQLTGLPQYGTGAPIVGNSGKFLYGFRSGSSITVSAIAVPGTGNPTVVASVPVFSTLAGAGNRHCRLVLATKAGGSYAVFTDNNANNVIYGNFFSWNDAANTISNLCSGSFTTANTNLSNQTNGNVAYNAVSFSSGTEFNVNLISCSYNTAGNISSLEVVAFASTTSWTPLPATPIVCNLASGNLVNAVSVVKAGDSQAAITVSAQAQPVVNALTAVLTKAGMQAPTLTQPPAVPYFSSTAYYPVGFDDRWAIASAQGTRQYIAASNAVSFVNFPIGVPSSRLAAWNPVYKCWCVANGQTVYYYDAFGNPLGSEWVGGFPITALDICPNGNVAVAGSITSGVGTVLVANSNSQSLLIVYCPNIYGNGSGVSVVWQTNNTYTGTTFNSVIYDVLMFDNNTAILLGMFVSAGQGTALASIIVHSAVNGVISGNSGPNAASQLYYDGCGLARWNVSGQHALGLMCGSASPGNSGQLVALGVTVTNPQNAAMTVLGNGSSQDPGAVPGIFQVSTPGNGAAGWSAIGGGGGWGAFASFSGGTYAYSVASGTLLNLPPQYLSVSLQLSVAGTLVINALTGTAAQPVGSAVQVIDAAGVTDLTLQGASSPAAVNGFEISQPSVPMVMDGLFNALNWDTNVVLDAVGSSPVTADVQITNSGASTILYKGIPLARGATAENKTPIVVPPGEKINVRASIRNQVDAYAAVVEH
ncbi:MAG: hypothetical protein F8N39_05825 [Clostridiaceae bacterium]|nr:hypothetical protein [Clostridiaceae bacterium]